MPTLKTLPIYDSVFRLLFCTFAYHSLQYKHSIIYYLNLFPICPLLLLQGAFLYGSPRYVTDPANFR